MDIINKKHSRKKFISLGITSAALLTAFRFLVPEKKKKEEKTVKMLTQDGKLVEVSAEKFLASSSKKINDDQLKSWVSKK